VASGHQSPWRYVVGVTEWLPSSHSAQNARDKWKPHIFQWFECPSSADLRRMLETSCDDRCQRGKQWNYDIQQHLCWTFHVVWCTAGRLKPTALPSSGDEVKKCTCSGEHLRKSCSHSLYSLTVNGCTDNRNWTLLSRRSNQSGWHGRACRVLVGKPKGNTPFGRPRSKWEVNIKMDLK
jgi:hypothetical protein